MIKPILTDRKILSQTCTPVAETTPYGTLGGVIQNLYGAVIQDLHDTAATLTNCAGLAAPQIGHKSRIILVNVQGKQTIMINPEYIERKGKLISGKEGCFSVPSTLGKGIMVRRYNKICIRYLDQKGKLVKKRFKAFEARLVQHEMDHLEGILI